MQSAAKTSSHNVAMKAAFKKFVSAVEEMAAIFEDDYEAPAPKERAKCGTGKAAQKKAALAATGEGAEPAKKAGRPKKAANELVSEATPA